MYRFTSHIEITTASGKLPMDYVGAIETVNGIESLTGTCKLVLPRNLKLKDKNIRDIINVGDKISVEAGYNDENELLFTGYISKIQPGTPIHIYCEDEMYLFKKVKVENKHYETVTLQEFFDEWLPEGIKAEIADVNLGELRIENEPTLAKVFDSFRQNYELNFFFRDGVLYGVLPSVMASLHGVNEHKLKLHWNTLDKYQLKYINGDDVEVSIVAKNITKDNVKIEARVPEGEPTGNVITRFIPGAQSEEDLKKKANEILLTYKQERLEGSFQMFGRPFVNVSDRVHLFSDRDKEFNDKVFLVKKVKRKFGTGSGYRQTITLGAKL